MLNPAGQCFDSARRLHRFAFESKPLRPSKVVEGFLAGLGEPDEIIACIVYTLVERPFLEIRIR